MATGGNTLTRNIVKAMGLFGSLQVMNILCSVIRTKLIALWIGPAGMGLFAIFNSAVDMIGNITGMGLRTSSVRNISQETGNVGRLAIIVNVVRRWSVVLGLFGALSIACASPLLSEMSFGDRNHIWGYIALSIALFANSVTNGEFSILQGTAMLRKLAKASLYGAISGLILSIPLYYFLGEQSIIPSIICYSLSVLFFSHMMRNKEVGKVSEHISVKDTIAMGKDFLKLGIFITLTDVVAQTSNYIFISYLNNVADTEIVGYYQAGYTLIAKYTGLILSALCVEYFPRLSRVAHSNMKLNIFVSQELNIALLALTPVIVAFILFRRVIISILYTDDFFIIETFISIGIIGMIFRAVSWCMAFVILAKGKGKMFFITEVIDTVVYLSLYIVSYRSWGLDGFGYAFVAWYFTYTLIVAFCYYRIFKLKLKKSCYQWIVWALISSVSALLCMENDNVWGTAIILVLTVVFSGVRFRKLIGRK